MKSFVFVLLIVGASLIDASQHLYGGEQPVLDDDLIARVNHDPTVHWLAHRSPRFEGMSVADAKRMLGVNLDEHQLACSKLQKGEPIQDAPSHFSVDDKWPGCVTRILNQEQCGSCWAFGAAESMSDRFCTYSNGTVKVELSPQDLVSCDIEGNHGCGGGIPGLAMDYIELKGIRTLECLPYTSGKGDSGSCPHSCTNSSASDKRYKAKFLSAKHLESESAIQKALMEGGSVEGTMSVYQDFMSYKSGVYKHTTGSFLGGHAIRITGWGTTSAGEKYWIIANSWGTSWGQNGYFWIVRGENNCGIDSGAVCAEPAL